MSLLSGAIHAVGDVVAPVAYGVGAVTGSNSLKQAATNIASPTAVLSNPGGILKNNDPAFTGSGADYPSASSGSSSSSSKSTGGSGSSSSTGGGSSSTGGSSGSSASANALTVSQAQSALAQAEAALNNANATTGATLSNQEATLDNNTNQQQINYNDQLTSAQQGLVDSINQIRGQTAAQLAAIDRIIGAMGGGGSTTETLLVPKVVGSQEQDQVAGANSTAATNEKNATDSWNTFLNQVNQQKQSLQNQAAEAEAENTAKEQSEQTQLAQLIAQAQGGGASADTLSNNLQDIEQGIPNVVAWSPTPLSLSTYTPAALSSYELTPTQINAAAGNVPTAPTSPLATAINLVNQQKQNNGTPALVPATT